ncbi:MAG: XdhC family protein [Treponemataceae bacterium]
MTDCKIFYQELKNQYEKNNSFFLITCCDEPLLAEKIIINPISMKDSYFSSNEIKELYQKNKDLFILDYGTQKINNQHFLVEKISQKPQLVLCGAGHISQSLCPLGQMLDFDTVVIDERQEFANKNIFPTATQIICDDFEQAIRKLANKENSYFVVVTQGHIADRICLTEILKHEVSYVGMIGSHKKKLLVFDYIQSLNVSEKKLQSVHSPIGLPIKAKTPTEIAISILAQIIKVKNTNKETHYFSPDFFDNLLCPTKESCVLVTVIKKIGSVPSILGGRMIISPAGRIFGTVGGGMAEHEAIVEGQKMIMTKTPHKKILYFKMTNNDAKRTAMSCGGEIELLLELSAEE